MHNEVGPVLHVFAAPDELRVEVAVAALVGHLDRALIGLVHHGLVFGRGNVGALRFLVGERLDFLAGRRLLAAGFLR